MDHNTEHKVALASTGFWGNAGAGTIIYSRKTKRFLLQLRSEQCLQPLTWGSWGGAIDGDESPEEAVKREKCEECGYTGEYQLVRLFVFASGTFRYFNFISVIDDEFEPTLNWETERAEWFHLHEFPAPLHFGMTAVLNDPDAYAILESLAR